MLAWLVAFNIDTLQHRHPWVFPSALRFSEHFVDEIVLAALISWVSRVPERSPPWRWFTELLSRVWTLEIRNNSVASATPKISAARKVRGNPSNKPRESFRDGTLCPRKTAPTTPSKTNPPRLS